jgi:hypothetical protein
MKRKLWPLPLTAKEAALTRRLESVCLDKAFVLIEGAPGAGPRVPSASVSMRRSEFPEAGAFSVTNPIETPEIMLDE